MNATAPLCPPTSRAPLLKQRRKVRTGLSPESARAVILPAASPRSLPEGAERHCAKVRSRIIRNGVLVVGGSILASLLFVELSFELAGDVEYEGSMLFALLIPLVVASAAYGWIAALTLRLERSNAALDRLAHTDPLTGLANRRAAMATLAEWTDLSGSIASRCSVAIADIDDFKCINDRFGHDTGDAALTHVATVLQRLAGEGWLVARIGGEEFLLAAPAPTSAHNFATQIEAMRAGLAATALIAPAGPHTITASFGLAEWHADEPLERLLARADRALYRAKEKGRNRVETAG